MLTLALDTTTRAGSAALVTAGRIVRQVTGDPAVTHGHRLPGTVMTLLDEADVALADVELFAVAAGPGSFTGLRVGIAVVQGLAFATGRRVVPVSALDALARIGADGTRLVATWIDAQRGEVYASMFERDGRTVIAAPAALPPEAALRLLPPAHTGTPIRFIGDGAVRYAAIIREARGPDADVPGDVPLLAGCIGQLAIERATEAVVPHAIVPLYIRRPDAELVRERQTGA